MTDETAFHEVDIFKMSQNTWAITGKIDRILVVLEHGEVNFYRLTDVSDISEVVE